MHRILKFHLCLVSITYKPKIQHNQHHQLPTCSLWQPPTSSLHKVFPVWLSQVISDSTFFLCLASFCWCGAPDPHSLLHFQMASLFCCSMYFNVCISHKLFIHLPANLLFQLVLILSVLTKIAYKMKHKT